MRKEANFKQFLSGHRHPSSLIIVDNFSGRIINDIWIAFPWLVVRDLKPVDASICIYNNLLIELFKRNLFDIWEKDWHQ